MLQLNLIYFKCIQFQLDLVIANQIKSNHFYCHITTAQVPWWVKFLWACSRQCKKKTTTTTIYIWTDSAKKTTSNLHMDRQCKKKQQTIYIWTDSAKKTTTTIYIWTDSAKKKKNNLHMDRQCKKTTAIYIWTVHIYRLYRRQCAKYTYIYSVHIVYYKDTLNYQRHIIHRMGTSTLCTLSIHNVVFT